MMTRLTHLPLFLMIQMTAAGRNGQALAKTEFMRNMNRAAAEHNLPLYSEEQLGTIARKERLHRNLLKNAISVKALKSSDKPESVDIEGTETDHRQLADEYADTSSINLLSYSLKYQGCASLSSYSDEKAYSDESSVMSTKQFVNFRLCPSNSCSNSTKNGCGYGYGEYLIPMSEYLTSFIGYKQETFQQYCNYCKQCMYFENYFYGNRNLEDQHACKYYDACEDYSDVCSDDDDNNEESSTFSDCSYVGSGYNDNGGGYFYAGPYCDSDQSTIKIGLYSDQYCTKYLYDSSDISDYTGDDMDETSLSDLSRGDCISCRKSDLEWSTPNDSGQDDEAISLCEDLHTSAAKCEQHVSTESGTTAYQSSSRTHQWTTDTQCLFVQSVAKGSYDDNGIVLVPGADRMVYFSNDGGGSVGTGQLFMLIVLAAGCGTLMYASIYIKKRLDWTKKKAQFLQKAVPGGPMDPRDNDISPSTSPHPQFTPPTEEDAIQFNRHDLVEYARSEDEKQLYSMEMPTETPEAAHNDDFDDRILDLRTETPEAAHNDDFDDRILDLRDRSYNDQNFS